MMLCRCPRCCVIALRQSVAVISRHPAPPALAELLSVLFDVNRRLQPYLENYRDILQRDPAFTAEVGFVDVCVI